MPTETPPSRQEHLEITDMTATRLAHALATRELSSVEVLSAFLAQIEQQNPRVNAIVAEQPREGLIEQAQQLDQHIVKHGPVGPLHGLPQAPKDISPVKGIVTTLGSPIFKNQVPSADAIIYERTRAAGAIFIGRTNTPEFGLGGHTYNTVYGKTRNAFDPALSAGGSSGGAAVALALHMLPVADGSDMMGSLRTPAAFNNVFGFRPSMGCVPGDPSGELFNHQFSTAGPMARNVPDLALLLKVQAGFEPRLPISRPVHFDAALETNVKGTRMAWLGDFDGALPVEPEVMAQAQSALVHFQALGCSIETPSLNVDMEQLYQAWVVLRSFSFYNTNRVLYENHRELLKPEAIWEAEQGAKVTAPDLHHASKVRSDFYRSLMKLFEQVDYIITPTTQVMPFDIDLAWPKEINGRQMDYYHRWMQIVITSTLSGLPALAAPAGLSAKGIPSGIQIMGKPQADWDVLQLGHAYDVASGYSQIRSPWL